MTEIDNETKKFRKKITVNAKAYFVQRIFRYKKTKPTISFLFPKYNYILHIMEKRSDKTNRKTFFKTVSPLNKNF